ncbi:capsid protein [Antarctic virus CAA_003_44]|nr:capsid protein [Antarctic virus CAA_003_44]
MKRKNEFSSGTYSKVRKGSRSTATKKAAQALLTAAKRKRAYSGAPRVRPEIKTVDTRVVTQGVISDVPQLWLINATAQGTGTFNRIGTKTTIKSIQFRFSIEPVGAQAFNDVARMIMVYDKQPNRVLPSFSDIIQSKSNIGAVNSGVDAYKNIDNTERFQILMDQQFYLPGVKIGYDTSFSSNFNGTYSKFMKVRLPVQYQGTANPPTLSEVNSGAIFIYIWSAIQGGYAMSGDTRVRFYDS